MPRRSMGVLVASLLLVGSTTAAQSSPAVEAPTRTVEIPGAGALVTMPREWRTRVTGDDDSSPWSAPAVWTTDVAAARTCEVVFLQGEVWGRYADAAEAADALVGDLEYLPVEFVERAELELPAGDAVRVSHRFVAETDEPRPTTHELFVDVPEGVVRIYCGKDAPVGRLLDIARTIAPLTADFSPGPFDPRIEVTDHGFAVDFGEEWMVQSWIPSFRCSGARRC